jgi:hypothetical protein
MKSAKGQLATFMARYTPEIQRLAKKVLTKLRARVPGAVEMVYDNYNWLVIGFGPTDRPSEAILSVVLAPRWVTLCFLWGATLPDPQKLLRGGGKRVRHIRLERAEDLDKTAIRSLIALAAQRARTPIDGRTPRRLIVKSISPKQRPRRPA